MNPEIVITKSAQLPGQVTLQTTSMTLENEIPATPLTSEQLAERAKTLHDVMGWGAPPERTPAKAATPEVVPAVVPAAPAIVPKVEVAPVSKAEDSLSTEAIIQRTAEATATAVADKLTPKPNEQVQSDPGFEMTAEDVADYKVFLWLQNTGQPEFAGIADKFLAYVKKYYAYQEEWESKNGGKQFNDEDPEHEAWFAANDHGINPDVIEQGRLDMRVEQRVEKALAPQRQQEEARRKEEIMGQNVEVIARAVSDGVANMVRLVDPTLYAHISDAEGRPNMTAEGIEKLTLADPIARDVMDDVVRRQLEPMLVELERSCVAGLDYQLNPSKNAIHRAIQTFVDKAEADIGADPEKQVRDGKKFLSIADYQSRLSKIAKSNVSATEKEAQVGALDAKHFTLTVDDIEAVIIGYHAVLAKHRIDKMNNLAQKKYGPARAAAVSAPQPVPVSIVQPVVVESGKPRPPAITGGADVTTTGKPGENAIKSFGQTAAEITFGG